MKNLTVKILMVVFLLVGVGFIFGGVIFFVNTKSFIKSAQSYQGEVISIVRSESGFSPVVRFVNAENIEIDYISDVYSNPSRYEVGEKVGLYHIGGNNPQTKINGFLDLWFFTVFTIPFGASFLLAGFALWFIFTRGIRNKKWLKINGVMVSAALLEVRKNRNVYINNKNPYYLVAEWKNPMDGLVYEFRSEYLWYDPVDKIEVGQPLESWVDMNNPKKHYINIDFLLNI